MHISFDFDYTLADSSEGTVACAAYAFRILGIRRAPDLAVKRTIGLNLRETYSVLTGDSSTIPRAAEFEMHFLAHAEKVMLGHIRLYEGTANALSELKSRGHHLSVVSTKCKARIEEAFRRDGLMSTIDQIIGGTCVEKNKPDPEGLLRAVANSGIDKFDTIFVGDSVADAECAKNAGVKFIGVLSGHTARGDLANCGMLCSVEGIKEIPKIVEGISSGKIYDEI